MSLTKPMIDFDPKWASVDGKVVNLNEPGEIRYRTTCEIRLLDDGSWLATMGEWEQPILPPGQSRRLRCVEAVGDSPDSAYRGVKAIFETYEFMVVDADEKES